MAHSIVGMGGGHSLVVTIGTWTSVVSLSLSHRGMRGGLLLQRLQVGQILEASAGCLVFP
jgi:hypothetical protein